MDPIIIELSAAGEPYPGSYRVRQGGKMADGLCFGEMLEQVISLVHIPSRVTSPDRRGSYRMDDEAASASPMLDAAFADLSAAVVERYRLTRSSPHARDLLRRWRNQGAYRKTTPATFIGSLISARANSMRPRLVPPVGSRADGIDDLDGWRTTITVARDLRAIVPCPLP